MRCFLSSKSALEMKTSSAQGSLSAWSLHADACHDQLSHALLNLLYVLPSTSPRQVPKLPNLNCTARTAILLGTP